jgi:hypothetical protein
MICRIYGNKRIAPFPYHGNQFNHLNPWLGQLTKDFKTAQQVYLVDCHTEFTEVQSAYTYLFLLRLLALRQAQWDSYPQYLK